MSRHGPCSRDIVKDVARKDRAGRPYARPTELALKSAKNSGHNPFGANGDIVVINQKLGKPDVEKFNKEAEVIDYYMKYPQLTSNQQRSEHKFRLR